MSQTKEKMLKDAYDRGVEYEISFGWCSQCSFLAIREVCDLPDPNGAIFKALVGLGGGGGSLTEGSCGAFSGGVLALGTLYGRPELTSVGWGSTPNKNGSKTEEKRLLNMIHELADRFKENYGSYLCKDILKKIHGRTFNFWDPKDAKEFKKKEGSTKCGEVVGNAAMWVTDILLQQQEQQTTRF